MLTLMFRVFELFTIYVLARKAAQKGRSRFYGALGLAFAYTGLLLSLVVWLLFDALFFEVHLPIPVFGYLIGLFMAWKLIDRLNPAKGFRHLYETSCPACPGCGSLQTSRVGDRVECYACDRHSFVPVQLP